MMGAAGFKKRACGQVTVYAALSLGLVLSLICTCVQSVKIAVADAEINMAARLSTEAVFAGYNNTVLDEFGIFVISTNQCCDDKLDYYARQNVENIALRNQVTYGESAVTDKVYMTDNGGYGLSNQVTEYMRSGGYAQIIKDFFDIDAESKKTEKINEVTSKVDEIDDKLSALDETDKKIIRAIRSLDGYSPDSYITDICDDVEMYAECVEADDVYGAGDFADAYEKNKAALLKCLRKMSDKFNEIIALIDEYDSTDSKADTLLNECRSVISAGSSDLGELSPTMRNDIDDIAVTKTTDREKKVNKKRIRPILEKNIEICEQLISQVEEMDSLSYESAAGLMSQCDSLGAACAKLDILGLSSECADVDIDSGGTGTGTLKNIRSMIENGISGIVLSGMEVRQGSYSHSGLATSYQSSSGDYSASGSSFNGIAGEVVDAALFNAYVLEKFPSYTDVHGQEGDGSWDNWSELNYVTEYIIAGNDNDVSNLNEVILKLSAVREATNFTHILTDAGKRREALTLAGALVGASANGAAVKAAQYVIMGAWSYAESVVDVRRLLKGEELAPIKNAADWKMSLENLMKMNFDVADAAGSVGSGNSGQGSAGKFSYKDYLGVILLSMNQTTKNYRTMQAMELRVIAQGQTDFRMKKHVYEAVCSVSMTIDYGGQNIERKQKYSYAGE